MVNKSPHAGHCYEILQLTLGRAWHVSGKAELQTELQAELNTKPLTLPLKIPHSGFVDTETLILCGTSGLGPTCTRAAHSLALIHILSDGVKETKRYPLSCRASFFGALPRAVSLSNEWCKVGLFKIAPCTEHL